MYCDSCGVSLQAGQSFCSRCGKAIVTVAGVGQSRVARHAQLLGILWIAYSALSGLLGLGILFFARAMLPAILRAEPPSGGPPPEVMLGVMRPLMTFFCLLLLCKAVAGMIAGIGLLQRASWSRMLAIVLGCISLVNLPFGTAIGVYTLWVLLSPNAENDFRGAGLAASA